MNYLKPTDLKPILHSKRANIFYLEKCRVMQKDGRILYLTDAVKEKLYWNIPVANTTCLLLGTGTSITQAAMRLLSAAGVIVGFCGGGGTPLFGATEVEWLNPQSEYRPTEYMQGWMGFWFEEKKRLEAAKILQNYRVNYMRKVWDVDRDLIDEGFSTRSTEVSYVLKEYERKMPLMRSNFDLLNQEALMTKKLYKIAAKNTKLANFTREREATDLANAFLNHGNYLAYGLAATALWVLGIPHGFAVMHGKTRRGALVFDVADIIKDTLILPWAFICAKEGNTEQEFRQQCLQNFTKHKALDFMFDSVKAIALKKDWISESEDLS